MSHVSFEQASFDFGLAGIPIDFDLDIFPEVPPVPTIGEPGETLPEEPIYGPHLPNWSESSWLKARAAEEPGTVVLVRSGQKAVAAVPTDLYAAAMLEHYRHSEPLAGELDVVPKTDRKYRAPELVFQPTEAESGDVLRAHLKHFKTRHNDGRLFFRPENVLASRIEESFLYRHLESTGVRLVVSPSLANWAPRATRRRELELTPFELPEISGSENLFDIAEVGLVLRASQTGHGFQEGADYVVVEVDAESEWLKLMRTDLTGAGAITWTATDGAMEEYLALPGAAPDLYDPEKCIRKRYPQLIAAMEQKLGKLGFDLFLHSEVDAVQAALKHHVWLGKPMRMGKTAEALTVVTLWGTKKVLVVSPKNVRRVIVKEMGRLGIEDFRMVDKVADLEAAARFFLVSYSWLKGQVKKRRLKIRPERKYQVGKRLNYEFPEKLACPHCKQMLVRPVKGYDFNQSHAATEWVEYYGYMCRNQGCHIWIDNREKVGAAWNYDARRHGAAVGQGDARKKGGYVDLGRKQHFERCIQAELKAEPKGDTEKAQQDDLARRIRALFKGRACRQCGYVADPWVPANYKRVKRAGFGCTVVDEIHNIKGGTSTDQAQAVMALDTKRRIGLTGTMMPNAPDDPYWPFSWIFVGGTHRFPYLRTGEKGLSKYRSEFVKMIPVVNANGDVINRKCTPYVKDVEAFQRMVAPKMIRRVYDDPLVRRSLTEKGIVNPTASHHTLLIDPTPEQAALMLASIDHFYQHFEQYKQEVEAKAAAEEKPVVLNSARVLPLMMRMRIAATCPDIFNTRLAKLGCLEPIYKGAPGGGKMAKIRDLVAASRREGKKTVIFSFFRQMQSIMAAELAEFGALQFNTSWDEGERFDAFERFASDPSVGAFIGGPLSMGEGVDLAANGQALTCICADLLWVPGKMAQAWSRILAPLKGARHCEIYRLLMKASIDVHVWDVFYAKQMAAEQAFDRKILTRKDKAIDIQAFVNRVMAGRSEILALLSDEREVETVYVPAFEMMDGYGDRD